VVNGKRKNNEKTLHQNSRSPHHKRGGLEQIERIRGFPERFLFKKLGQKIR
jgi:hypothetical protein